MTQDGAGFFSTGIMVVVLKHDGPAACHREGLKCLKHMARNVFSFKWGLFCHNFLSNQSFTDLGYTVVIVKHGSVIVVFCDDTKLIRQLQCLNATCPMSGIVGFLFVDSKECYWWMLQMLQQNSIASIIPLRLHKASSSSINSQCTPSAGCSGKNANP